MFVPPNLEIADYLIISTTSLSSPSGIQLFDEACLFNTLYYPIDFFEPFLSIKSIYFIEAIYSKSLFFPELEEVGFRKPELAAMKFANCIAKGFLSEDRGVF